MLLADNNVPLARRLLRWMALREKPCSFLGRCGGGMKESFWRMNWWRFPTTHIFPQQLSLLLKSLDGPGEETLVEGTLANKCSNRSILWQLFLPFITEDNHMVPKMKIRSMRRLLVAEDQKLQHTMKCKPKHGLLFHAQIPYSEVFVLPSIHTNICPLKCGIMHICQNQVTTNKPLVYFKMQ